MEPAEAHISFFPPTLGMIFEGSLTRPTFDGVNKENQGRKKGVTRCDGPRTNAARRALRDVDTNVSRIKLALPLLPSGSKRVERASHAPSIGQNISVGSGAANNKKMRMESIHDPETEAFRNDVASTPNNQNDHPRQRVHMTEDSSLLPSEDVLFCDEPHGRCWRMGDAKPVSLTSFQQPTTNRSGLDKPAEGMAKVFDRKMHVPITPVQETGPLNRFSGTKHVTPSPINPPISAMPEDFSPVYSPYSVSCHATPPQKPRNTTSPVFSGTTTPTWPSQGVGVSKCARSRLLCLASAAAVAQPVLLSKQRYYFSLGSGNAPRTPGYFPTNDNHYQCLTSTPMTPKSSLTSSSQTAQGTPPLFSDNKTEKKLTVVIGNQKQPGFEEVVSCSVLRSPPIASYTEYSTPMTPRALAGASSSPVAQCPIPTEKKMTIVEGHRKQAGTEASPCSVVKSPPGGNSSSTDCSTPTTPQAPMRIRSSPTTECTTPLFSGKTKETTMTIVEGHQKKACDEEGFFCSVLRSPPCASSSSCATGLPLLQRAISLLDDMLITGDVFHYQFEAEGEDDDCSLFYGA
jgi:hypothetical protein